MPESRRSFIGTPLVAGFFAGPLSEWLSAGTGREQSPGVLVAPLPNGTDDTAAIQGLLDTAASRGGTVTLRPAPLPYRLSHALNIPTHVSLAGESPGTRLLAIQSMESMVQVDAPLPLGSRLGTVANLVLDGNGVADAGLVLKACVERAFEHLSINNCRLSGVRLLGSQNNLFVGVNIEYNGSAVADVRRGGLELLTGAGNNCFLRCEFNRNGGYQVMIAGKGDGTYSFDAGPSGNVFLGCVFERPQSNTRAAIYAGDGRMNTWLRCDIEHDGSVLLEGPADPSSTCALWRFYACAFSGSPRTTLISGGSRMWGTVLDGCLVENFEGVSDPTTAERVAILPTNQVSNVTRWAVEAHALLPSTKALGGGWDSQHLVLGDAHLWVDPHGELRYGLHAPNGPYDGRRLVLEPQ